MIGGARRAFPRLNLMSWYLYITWRGLRPVCHALEAWILAGRFIRPYSSTYSQDDVVIVALGIFIAGFSSILTGVNFIV